MEQNLFIHDTLPQDFYDAYNSFIFANESKVLDKLVSKYQFLERTRGVPGDIVELGVFKGSGLAAWLKLAKSNGIRRKVYGFDIFDSEQLVANITTVDRELMKSLFEQRNFDTDGYFQLLVKKLQSIGFFNFELVKGDIHDTLPKFLHQNPGFRASIVNFDLDTFEPTYFALERLWERVVPGGVLIFDEYGINEWTESDAVDKFLGLNKLTLNYTNYFSPSAYLTKE